MSNNDETVEIVIFCKAAFALAMLSGIYLTHCSMIDIHYAAQ